MGDKMNNQFMLEAIKCSKKALDNNEVPVGCVIVKDNTIISRGFNKRERSKLITSHAEIIAITKAEKKLNDWRLNGCSLYTTLFPCPMCASAIQQSRISKIYYILPCTNSEFQKISEKILQNNFSNHRVEVICLQIKCKILDMFFKEKRNNNVSRETKKNNIT